jgi:hypothetical protein
MPQKLKRKQTLNTTSALPTRLLSSLEESDKRASTKRRKQFTSHTLPKSLATKSSYDIHTNLIESRILLQRTLTNYSDYAADADGDASTSSNGNDDENIEKGLNKLLDKLVEARNMLCGHTIRSSKDGDDEEGSNSDESNETKDESDDEDDNNNNNNNDDDDDDDDKFQKDYNKLQKKWKTTLNRHYENMNISKRYNSKRDAKQNSKFFQVVDQSFWSQIENTVQHNMLLEEHTQIKNKNDDDLDSSTSDGIPNDNKSNTITLAFDDSRIYQHMLQEYITLSTERTTSNATSMAEHRLKLASSKANRKTNKEDIDRRASKGRKIRYVVHDKLKNFTFPLQREVNRFTSGQNTTHAIMDENVLFKSMMGGVFMK